MLMAFPVSRQLFHLESAQVPGAGFGFGELSLEYCGLTGFEAVDRQRGAASWWHQATELYGAQLRLAHEDLGLTHEDRCRQRIVDMDLTEDACVRQPYPASQPLIQGDDTRWLISQGCRGKHRVDDHIRQVRRGVEKRGPDSEPFDRSTKRLRQRRSQVQRRPTVRW
jgi:hypothetical protein